MAPDPAHLRGQDWLVFVKQPLEDHGNRLRTNCPSIAVHVNQVATQYISQ